RDGEAHARALHKAQNQKVDRTRAAHRGKRIHADVLADDDAIRHAVKLLEEIAQKQWRRKGQYSLERVPFGHVANHMASPFFFPMLWFFAASAEALKENSFGAKKRAACLAF